MAKVNTKKVEESKIEGPVESRIRIDREGNITVVKRAKKSTSKVQKTYYLDEDLVKKIDDLMEATGMTASDVIAMCVESAEKRISYVEEE